MFVDIQVPLFFGLIAALVTSIGLVAVAQKKVWSERHAGLFALAAGGMLLTLIVLHIAPEAFELSSHAAVLIAVGFFAALIVRTLLNKFFGDKAAGSSSAIEAVAPILAIAIHSFLDGIIYAVTFAASFESGLFAALSLILHEFPEGVIAFAILRRTGVSNRNAFFFAFLAAAATTPLGVLAAAPSVNTLGAEDIGNLFAVSAGLLLFVATGPLLAPIRTQPSTQGFAALACGVIFAFGLNYLPLNGHRHAKNVNAADGGQASFEASVEGRANV
ncbi:MAG: ZIP family metal transporter [Pseudomonadota bacterium]